MPDLPVDLELAVEARGAGEWIVSAPDRSGALHVYRLGPGDWLVSEVGQENEGRGRRLEGALAMLSSPDWPAERWPAIAAALEAEES